MMEWLKKVPTSLAITLIIMGGIVTMVVLGGYVALSLAGLPTDDFTRFVNTLMNFVLIPISILGTTASVAAARSAGKAEEHTNGGPGGMKATMKEAVLEVHQENGGMAP
jgi:hypothetical protein